MHASLFYPVNWTGEAKLAFFYLFLLVAASSILCMEEIYIYVSYLYCHKHNSILCMEEIYIYVSYLYCRIIFFINLLIYSYQNFICIYHLPGCSVRKVSLRHQNQCLMNRDHLLQIGMGILSTKSRKPRKCLYIEYLQDILFLSWWILTAFCLHGHYWMWKFNAWIKLPLC